MSCKGKEGRKGVGEKFPFVPFYKRKGGDEGKKTCLSMKKSFWAGGTGMGNHLVGGHECGGGFSL